jgi:twitching motility protein PilT
MRDLETISTAITAAETGHLVMSTLHTSSAVQTIDRIIDVFPPHQQQQIRTMLASVVLGILSQHLIQKTDGSGRVAVPELLIATDAVRNIIREGKTHQLPTVMQSSVKNGMIPLDLSLANLVREGTITKDRAMVYCDDKEIFNAYLKA